MNNRSIFLAIPEYPALGWFSQCAALRNGIERQL
jgi:hypothetical protein